MRARFKNLLKFIIFLLICSFILGASYIVYIKYIGNGPEVKVIDDLSINYKNGRTFFVENEKDIEISIINNSDKATYYYIEFNNILGLKNAEFSLTDGKDLNINDKLSKYNTVIADYIIIDANETVNYKLKVKNLGKRQFKMSINIDIELLDTNNFADVILRNNEVKNSSDTIVGKEAALSNEGLIKTNDDLGSVYYFRGAINNNYVNINDNVFRIVRINSDGSVSLVLDGSTGTLQKYYSDAANVSFNNSELMTYLTNWLDTALEDSKGFVAVYKYCDDTKTDENGQASSYTRIKKDNIISHVCLGDIVSSKVGLLTVDDVIYAGGTLNDNNTGFYLYNSAIDTDYYLMTGASFSSNTFYPYTVNKDGKIISNVPGNYLRSIRPVITINKTTSVTGDGSVNNPYILTN